MISEPIIKLEGITKIYKTGEEDTQALKVINLEIEKGEFVAIMGPSGSGKSTLMHIIGLLDKPTAGTYFLNGKNVSKISGSKQSDIRNSEIGSVFQQFNLLPRTNVLDNVLLPTIYGSLKKAKERAKEIIKEVGLEDKVSNLSNQLSGGQIQRVAIARALVMDPSIILADEPTGNLDSAKTKELMALLSQINKKGSTIVLITHEETVASYAGRIIKLLDGQVA